MACCCPSSPKAAPKGLASVGQGVNKEPVRALATLEAEAGLLRTIERGFCCSPRAKLSHVCLFLGACVQPIGAAQTPLTSCRPLTLTDVFSYTCH